MDEKKVAEFYEIIVGDGSSLRKLLNKVPGLSGYLERGQRREADQLLRDTIGTRLQDVRLRLSNVHATLGRDMSSAVEYAEDLGRADNQLMGLIGKITEAPLGYAGFFDAVKVREEDLARLYHFDELMLNFTDQAAADVAALNKAVDSEGDIGFALRELNNDLGEANRTFDSRQEVLNKIK